MASNNNNLNKDGTVEKNFDVLAKFAALSFNPSGFVPSSTVYRITMGQLKPAVLNTLKNIINDIEVVTFEPNHKTGELVTLAWLPSDSKHLRDNSTMSEKSAVKLPISRYSNEIKEFMDRFCRNDQKVVVSDENGSKRSAIIVDLGRIARIMFDENGYLFSKEFGTQSVPAAIRLVTKFHPGSGGDQFGNFRYLEVTKTTKSGVEEIEPKARKSFKTI